MSQGELPSTFAERRVASGALVLAILIMLASVFFEGTMAWLVRGGGIVIMLLVGGWAWLILVTRRGRELRPGGSPSLEERPVKDTDECLSTAEERRVPWVAVLVANGLIVGSLPIEGATGWWIRGTGGAIVLAVCVRAWLVQRSGRDASGR